MQVAHDLLGPLLGRHAETALITSLLDGAADGGGRALVLTGGPGIGKTRLLVEAAALAGRRSMTILSTAGAQSEAQLAYAGLNRLLRPLRQQTALLSSDLREPLKAAFGVGPEGAVAGFRVGMAVLELVSEVAKQSPVLILVDDAQWLDRASSEVLAFVARRLEVDPVVLLAAALDGAATGITSADLATLRLDRLDHTTAETLLDGQFPRLNLATRARVLREADGNALALNELPKALENGSSTTGELPLTQRLERSFAARVSELPNDTRLLLLTAALLDGEDLGEVLSAASRAAGRTIGVHALEPAAASAIVEVGTHTIRFHHPLMRSQTER